MDSCSLLPGLSPPEVLRWDHICQGLQQGCLCGFDDVWWGWPHAGQATRTSLVMLRNWAVPKAAHVAHHKKHFQLFAIAVVPALFVFVVERDRFLQKNV